MACPITCGNQGKLLELAGPTVGRAKACDASAGRHAVTCSPGELSQFAGLVWFFCEVTWTFGLRYGISFCLMNPSFVQRTIQTALGLTSVAMLASSGFAAENAVLLDSFEQNIDIATALGGRATLSQYTATDPSDPNVTHGTKSLQVEITEQEWWVQDLRITFDDATSERIRQAALSLDEARYILRWDVVF